MELKLFGGIRSRHYLFNEYLLSDWRQKTNLLLPPWRHFGHFFLKYILKWQYRAGNGAEAGAKIRKKWS